MSSASVMPFHIGLLHVRICHVVKHNPEHNRRVLLAMLSQHNRAKVKYNSPMPLVTLSHVSMFSAAGICEEPIVLQIVIRHHATIQYYTIQYLQECSAQLVVMFTLSPQILAHRDCNRHGVKYFQLTFCAASKLAQRLLVNITPSNRNTLVEKCGHFKILKSYQRRTGMTKNMVWQEMLAMMYK